MADTLNGALLYVASLGVVGWAAFVVLYAAACIAFMPVSVLTLGAGAVFGVWVGFGLVWLGATLGACASFLIGRHWLRGWVERRVAHMPVFAAIDAAVSVEGWRIVVLTRLTPLFPFALQNYAYGLTRVRLSEYALASWLGMAPGTFLFVYIGAAAGEAVKAGAQGRVRTPMEWAFLAVGLLAAVAAVMKISREAKRALDKHTDGAAGATPPSR